MENAYVIKEYLVEEFLPDISPNQLDSDYDLLANGVIDSLGLLMVIAWLENRFDIAIDALDVTPDRFRTVASMVAFVEGAPHPGVVG